jgi:hypothetical protein
VLTRASPSTVPKPAAVKATERRHPDVDLKLSKDDDHFAAVSRALLDRNAKRRGVPGRVTAYLIFAILILNLGIGAYAYVTGQIKLPFLPRLLERVLDWMQRASDQGG